MWIILLGAPGCGKGTQSEKLLAEHGFIAISTGDLLRANRDKVIADGRRIGDIMDAGDLLPDNVTIDLIKDQLKHLNPEKVIFDGFPRTLAQAKALKEMAEETGKKIDRVINFEMDDEELIKRITGRFKCSKCGRIYNSFFLQPKKEGVCDDCGSTEFERRSDDNETSLRRRLSEYHEKTYPLIDFYSESGILYGINAGASFEEVTDSVLEVLNA